MSGQAQRQATASIRLERLPCPPPAEAYRLPVSGFPIPSDEAGSLADFLRKLIGEARRQSGVLSHAFFAIHPLAQSRTTERLSGNAPAWIPQMGLGVWVDREAPRLWTKDDFEQCKPGELLPPLVNYTCRVTAGSDEAEKAFDVMLGSGSSTLVLTTDDITTYLEKTRKVLFPRISQISFQTFPFYSPLMDAASFDQADGSMLTSWFCDVSLYIRESSDDKSILIGSPKPLRGLLHGVGMSEHPAGSWKLRR